jgi:cobalt-zinc-cadmium efflux system membrane fusion protein
MLLITRAGRFRLFAPILAFVVVIVTIAFLVFARRDNSETTAAAAQAKAETAAASPKTGPLQLSADDSRRAGLKVEKLELVNLAESIAVFGTIEADQDHLARVVPPVAGRVIEISARLGDQVESGAALATLDSPQVGEARATYQQDVAGLTLAKASLERTQSLVSGGSIARKTQFNAEYDYAKAKAELDAAVAKLANLGVSVTAPPDVGLAALAVRAPFAGTVIEKTAVLGEYAEAYKALFTVADLSSLWIETNLYERDLASVAIGASATVTVAAYPEHHFTGKVTYISSSLDDKTRTVKARVEIPNLDRQLKPGMFANVLIEKADHRPVLIVPETAVVLLQGQMTAFVADGDGYEPRPVEISEQGRGRVVITSGLEPGDEVVVTGAYALKARLLKSQISAD